MRRGGVSRSVAGWREEWVWEEMEEEMEEEGVEEDVIQRQRRGVAVEWAGARGGGGVDMRMRRWMVV